MRLSWYIIVFFQILTAILNRYYNFTEEYNPVFLVKPLPFEYLLFLKNLLTDLFHLEMVRWRSRMRHLRCKCPSSLASPKTSLPPSNILGLKQYGRAHTHVREPIWQVTQPKQTATYNRKTSKFHRLNSPLCKRRDDWSTKEPWRVHYRARFGTTTNGRAERLQRDGHWWLGWGQPGGAPCYSGSGVRYSEKRRGGAIQRVITSEKSCVSFILLIYYILYYIISWVVDINDFCWIGTLHTGIHPPLCIWFCFH